MYDVMSLNIHCLKTIGLNLSKIRMTVQRLYGNTPLLMQLIGRMTERSLCIDINYKKKSRSEKGLSIFLSYFYIFPPVPTSSFYCAQGCNDHILKNCLL